MTIAPPQSQLLVHVILRTCDRVNVHNDWRIRYCDMEKPELIRGCFLSLLKTIQQPVWYNVKLTVLDDNSSDDTVAWLKEQGSVLPNFEFRSLEDMGYRYSAWQQFMACRDSDADLVYCVEDDYLHVPTALQEMVESWFLFKEKLHREDILLYPFDAPECYDPPTDMSWLVHGTARHWRTGIFTTNVMFAKPELWQQNWETFEVLAKNYDGTYIRKGKENVFRYTEDNTIWNIWREGRAIRFNPVPSLALHMQFDRQMDPFIDWQAWWKAYGT